MTGVVLTQSILYIILATIVKPVPAYLVSRRRIFHRELAAALVVKAGDDS